MYGVVLITISIAGVTAVLTAPLGLRGTLQRRITSGRAHGRAILDRLVELLELVYSILPPGTALAQSRGIFS